MRKFLLVLVILLLGAVGFWFFWPEVSWRMGLSERKLPQSKGEAKEKIYEDDRRKLDELLKQRQSK